MSKIEQSDKNFKVETKLQKENIRFYNCLEDPFEILGLIKPTKRHPYFTRIDQDVAETVNDGVKRLNKHTAGGRVRFKTNSPFVAILAKMHEISKMPHCALTGSAGFDLYERKDGKECFVKTYVPPFDIADGYESIIEFENEKEREITIYLPLYSGIKELYIGLGKEADLDSCTSYKYITPIVYYGSSITQGGCASRPGMSYQSIISRRLNIDYINLGFAGSAKAEEEIFEYIINLDMSVFVYDYDHNSPSAEHLRNTHEKMFKKIRGAKPDIPIILMSRPKYILDENEKERMKIIKATYENAVSAGDKNVYFIDGAKLMELCGDEGTVDNCHPTDLGFFSMAKALGDVIDTIIQ